MERLIVLFGLAHRCSEVKLTSHQHGWGSYVANIENRRAIDPLGRVLPERCFERSCVADGI